MKRAIVLAGGGARGAYQMGFWRAIRELGIDYQIVTGSSVGALNAALMASGNFEGGLEMWESITTNDIIETSPTRLSRLFDTDGLAAGLKNIAGDVGENAVKLKMNPYPLHALIGKFLNEKDIRSGGVEVGIMTSEYPTLKTHPVLLSEVPFGMFDEYLLASSTVYPSMEPKEIAGKKYVDGGYSDNFPVNLALDMGAQEIIGVELKATGIEAKYQTDFPVRVIKPSFDLGQSMVFDPETSKRNIVLGYNDTMKSFGKYEGSCFSFVLGTSEAMVNTFGRYLRERMAECGCVSSIEKDSYYKTTAAKSLAEARKRRFGRMKYELPLLAAETAGDIFGVDPTPVYEHGEFGSAVLKAFEPAEAPGREHVEQVFSGAKTLSRKLALLKDIDRKEVTAYIASRLSETAPDSDSTREFRTLARFAPQEFFAGVYIAYLKESVKEQ